MESHDQNVKYCRHYGSFYLPNGEWFVMDNNSWKGFEPSKPQKHPLNCACLENAELCLVKKTESR